MTALAALVDELVADIGTDNVAALSDLQDAYERHRQLTAGSVHAAADADNPVEIADAATTQQGALYAFGVLGPALLGHFTGSTAAATAWHTDDDTTNLPATGVPRTVAQMTVALADWRLRGYERHRVQISTPTVHGGTGDSTNPLTVASSLLDDLIVAYLDAVVSQTATPTNESEGLEDAATRYGFAA